MTHSRYIQTTSHRRSEELSFGGRLGCVVIGLLNLQPEPKLFTPSKSSASEMLMGQIDAANEGDDCGTSAGNNLSRIR